jgi:hypothetical protein
LAPLRPPRRAPNGFETFSERKKLLEKNISKKGQGENPLKTKKEQGGKPCSENCVDPFVSPKIGFDLD